MTREEAIAYIETETGLTVTKDPPPRITELMDLIDTIHNS